LQLAGAQNLDTKIAGKSWRGWFHESAVRSFFRGFRRGSPIAGDNLIQDVAGNIIEVHKQSTLPAAASARNSTLMPSTSPRRPNNSSALTTPESQRQDSIFAAAQGYRSRATQPS
jgi:hypothetical protein